LCASRKEPPASGQGLLDDEPHPAVRRPQAVSVFLIVVLGGLIADLASKHFVFASMLRDPHLPQRIRQVQSGNGQPLTSRQVLQQLHLSRQVAPGVRFTITTNPGVVFGLPMPRWAILATTAITIVLVTFFFATSRPRAWFVHIAMSCILSGALGNLYDRMFSEVTLPGLEPIRRQVRDFIDCSQLHYNSVFNVADALLVIGAAMLVLHWLAGAAIRKTR